MRDEELQKARQIIETVLREHIESARFDEVALRLGYDADGDDVIFSHSDFRRRGRKAPRNGRNPAGHIALVAWP